MYMFANLCISTQQEHEFIQKHTDSAVDIASWIAPILEELDAEKANSS